MSEAQRSSGLAGYRDAVTARMRAREPFGDVEDSIEQAGDFGDPDEQLDARAHVGSLL